MSLLCYLTWQTLSHDRKGGPCPRLVGIVGAGHPVEELCEGIPVGERDAPNLRARRPEVPEGNVDREVAHLAKLLKSI